MARKPRIHFEGALYHVIVRGNNREFIFKDDNWKQKYLETIKRYKYKYGFKLYAYVLMDNHAHMLIEVNNAPLSKIMQCIQQVFTQTYNRKANRTGHVFEQRYKAILCEKDQYLLMLIRYIHQNPLRAGINNGLNYNWSSYIEYLDETKNDLCDVEFPLSLFKNRLDRFVEFMNEEETEIKKVSIREFSENIDEYKEINKDNGESTTFDLETIVARVCAVLNLEVDQISSKTRKREIANARQLIAFIASKNPEIKQKEIAERFNINQNSVSMMLSKENTWAKYEKEIAELMIY